MKESQLPTAFSMLSAIVLWTTFLISMNATCNEYSVVLFGSWFFFFESLCVIKFLRFNEKRDLLQTHSDTMFMAPVTRFDLFIKASKQSVFELSTLIPTLSFISIAASLAAGCGIPSLITSVSLAIGGVSVCLITIQICFSLKAKKTLLLLFVILNSLVVILLNADKGHPMIRFIESITYQKGEGLISSLIMTCLYLLIPVIILVIVKVSIKWNLKH